MQDKAKQILKDTFGYPEFRGHQEDIINHMINGGDSLVLMPTGGGKSLCYQIPAMLRDGVGIVISPLIALMQDQVSAIQENGVRAEFLNSSLTGKEAWEVENKLLENSIDLLYIAPERLLNDTTLNILRQAQISLFAIDEAHCVSRWGHDFRPDYLNLSILHEEFPEIPRLACTATADQKTREEIIKQLKLEEAECFVSGFDRPNICYKVMPKKNARKELVKFINTEYPGQSGIVYCLSRKNVDETALWLCDQGFNAFPYHAGMNNADRQKNQDTFLREENVIIVATIAFGMGIDKPDVRFVAHLNLPKSIEAYYQETGRAGRDGLPATAWMMYGMQDVVLLRQFIEKSTGDNNYKRIERQKLDAMLAYCEVTGCRREVLLSYFGDHQEEDCGNCDTCLDPVEQVDYTVAAQKALSCIFRTGQRFGVSYLVDVLTGSDNERIKNLRHDQVSTYGIGKDMTKTEWRTLYRQLVILGMVTVDPHFNVLSLTQKSNGLLKGEEKFYMRKQLKREEKEKRVKEIKAKTKSKKQKRTEKDLNEEDRKIFEHLRDCRTKIAKRKHIPSYVVFSNETLFLMAEQKPKDEEEMMEVSGVGLVKYKKYGEIFLDAVREAVEGD
ncbi:MAG: DNA helicase RecQ [Planctomycetota bacterium]|jgi:ATP-dependent DNA helicase RecQ